MPYALIQKTLDRPPVEALQRAFASGRGLTPADARFVSDDAFGLLARNLDLDDALFLQGSLGQEGVEVEVAPESELPRVPEPTLFTVLHGTDDRLVVFDALGRACDAPWSDVSVVCAGFDQREFKLEIFIHGTEQRFLATLDRLMFDQMPEFTNPSEPDNLGEKYRNLVKCIVEHSPKALLNRAAAVLGRDGLSGDITEAISYPRPTAYAEEQTWLLWRATHPFGG